MNTGDVDHDIVLEPKVRYNVHYAIGLERNQTSIILSNTFSDEEETDIGKTIIVMVSILLVLLIKPFKGPTS